jgi:uncharacterized membrane-anchored protein
MKTKSATLLLLGLLAAAQLAVPLGMIGRRELVLRTGTRHLFRTAPVDPYDAFRGRYVALRMEQDSVHVSDRDAVPEYGRKGFALLATATDGFAEVIDVVGERPHGRQPYLEVRVWGRGSDTNLVRIAFPFDRFYLNEEAAPEAERLYRDNSRRDRQNAYVAVRIRNGYAVLEDLFIADKPILEHIRAASE